MIPRRQQGAVDDPLGAQNRPPRIDLHQVAAEEADQRDEEEDRPEGAGAEADEIGVDEARHERAERDDRRDPERVEAEREIVPRHLGVVDERRLAHQGVELELPETDQRRNRRTARGTAPRRGPPTAAAEGRVAARPEVMGGAGGVRAARPALGRRGGARLAASGVLEAEVFLLPFIERREIPLRLERRDGIEADALAELFDVVIGVERLGLRRKLGDRVGVDDAEQLVDAGLDLHRLR